MNGWRRITQERVGRQLDVFRQPVTQRLRSLRLVVDQAFAGGAAIDAIDAAVKRHLAAARQRQRTRRRLLGSLPAPAFGLTTALPLEIGAKTPLPAQAPADREPVVRLGRSKGLADDRIELGQRRRR